MVIDSSILVAIMMEEAGFEELVITIGESETREVSVATYLEASMVLISKLGSDIELRFDRMLQQSEIVLIPVSVVQAQVARQAFRDYGKGRHPAGLNFGDCFAYALSKSRREPLFYKGNDFSQTDVEAV